jgi:hypothetical protein
VSALLTSAIDAHAGVDAEDSAPGWLTRALDDAEDAAAERRTKLEDESDKLEAAGEDTPDLVAAELVLLETVPGSVAVLREHAPAIYSWGRAKAASVLIRLGAGDGANARLLALARSPGFLQRRAASALSTKVTLEEAEARERATEETIRALEGIGQVALKVLIPILLASL